jgi:hypothetical protein
MHEKTGTGPAAGVPELSMTFGRDSSLDCVPRRDEIGLSWQRRKLILGREVSFDDEGFCRDHDVGRWVHRRPE